MVGSAPPHPPWGPSLKIKKRATQKRAVVQGGWAAFGWLLREQGVNCSVSGSAPRSHNTRRRFPPVAGGDRIICQRTGEAGAGRPQWSAFCTFRNPFKHTFVNIGWFHRRSSLFSGTQQNTCQIQLSGNIKWSGFCLFHRETACVCLCVVRKRGSERRKAGHAARNAANQNHHFCRSHDSGLAG